ncbi:MAG: hypothetical protein AAF432_16375, partial [Planctomycetota bacterium]
MLDIAWLVLMAAITVDAEVSEEYLTPPADLDLHHEVLDDPPKPYVRPADLPLAPLLGGGELSPGVQVNVDVNGNNIPGDAANEPSIAVDPINRNRIVIGWRQFDNVTSNFRQAGWGYSENGGESFTFPGSINAG